MSAHLSTHEDEFKAALPSLSDIGSLTMDELKRTITDLYMHYVEIERKQAYIWGQA